MACVVAAGLALAACGGKVSGGGGDCPPGARCPDDTGAPDDTAPPPEDTTPPPYDTSVPYDTYEPYDTYDPYDSSPPPWDSSYDSYPPPPDTGCGTGYCSPGSSCGSPCLSCYCLSSGTWTCSATPGCTDGGTPTCPIAEPSDGSPCLGSIDCKWPNSCGSADYGSCIYGTWRLKTDCTPPSGCPMSRPAPGSACASTAPYPYCKYPSLCGGGTDLAYCKGGAWSFDDAPCPPPPPCPYTTPPYGSYCPVDGQHCSIANSCGGFDDATCYGHGWSVAIGPCRPPPPPVCPPSFPSDGSYCPTDGQECDYGSACGTTDYAICSGNRWTTKSSCGSSCPTYEPKSGEACKTPSSTMCSYAGSAPGCMIDCFCALDYRWACYAPPCYDAGPPPPYEAGWYE